MGSNTDTFGKQSETNMSHTQNREGSILSFPYAESIDTHARKKGKLDMFTKALLSSAMQHTNQPLTNNEHHKTALGFDPSDT